MAIYLDSNILYPWRTFTELDRVAVSIVASQIQQLVLVPWLVAEEARAHYQRSLEDALDRMDSAIKAVNRTFDDLDEVGADPWPDVERQLEIWQARLDAMATTIPVVAEEAVEALRREVWGVAPARRAGNRSGDGARDAAIWLAIARDHTTREEEGHFVSADRDFFEQRTLRPPMEKDLTSAHPLHLHNDVSEFLSVLGSADDVEVELDDLREAVESVRVALSTALDIPRAVFHPLTEEHRYRTEVKQAQPVRFLAARRYERDGEALIVVNSEWEIVADLYHQEREPDDDSLWYVHEDIEATGTIQMYLPTGGHPDVLPQIIDARLKSDYSVWIRPERVMSIRRVRKPMAE